LPKRKRRRKSPEEFEEVPTGFQRLLRSESQKTKLADRRDKRPISGVAMAIHKIEKLEAIFDGIETKSEEPSRKQPEPQVKVRRGGEFIGNRMRFKVKLLNDSEFTVTDVTVYIISYPSDALRLEADDDSVHFPKLEPNGSVSPTFDFLPTRDCVRGDIVAGVSYIDMTGRPHTLSTDPFVIRSVCDLLIPDKVTPEDFELSLKRHEHGEIAIKVDEWTPEDMFEKALKIVDESNFFEVSSDIKTNDGVVFGNISGYAKGKYTGKNVGVQISITGPERKSGASCTIRVSGEDQAMILPAIDDLRERLSAWLCPLCSSPLPLSLVEELRLGEIVVCPCCNVSISR